LYRYGSSCLSASSPIDHSKGSTAGPNIRKPCIPISYVIVPIIIPHHQDCDGVIFESSELHRQAYNATFRHFDVRDGVWCAGVE
jgi:hypothetical protein